MWSYPYNSSNNKFKVFVKDGFDPHFKTCLRAFDPDAILHDMQTHYIVETKIEESEIKGWTTVKNVSKIINSN